jgi:hypothetical protein
LLYRQTIKAKMKSTFLIFGGHDWEGENLLGGRETADEAVAAAQELARNIVVSGYGHDYIRIVEVPAGNWGANVDEQNEQCRVWIWHRPHQSRRSLSNLPRPLEVDMYPFSQAGAKAARHTRTRGPMTVVAVEPLIEDIAVSVPEHLWTGKWYQ